MEAANIFVPIALVAFVPAVAGLFAWLGPRRGVVVSLLAGWMLLPSYDSWFKAPFLTSKAMFVPVVVLVTSLAFDARSWLRLRPRLLDLPMALWCLEPFVTSLVNGLGAYDGAHAVFHTTSVWGVPYLLGRIYLDSPRALSDLAKALVVAALAYVPLCLWEVRMSPNLHLSVYGFHPMDFLQAIRFGGYRPNVFMSHGLMLGMVMASATLVAYWEWRTRARTLLGGIPYGWVVAVLVVMTLLVKATGAILLLALGMAVLEGTRRIRAPWLLLALILVPPAYSAARIAGWTGDDLVTLSSSWIDPERADSLKYRMDHEDALIEKAMQRPGLGWGRWGRSRIFDEDGRDVSVTDGMWIITLGVSGLVGLAALILILALPVVAFLRRFPAAFWGDARLAAPAALAVVVLLWAIDDLPNAVVTPFPPTIAGALVTCSLLPRAVRRRRSRAAPVSRLAAPRPGQSAA